MGFGQKAKTQQQNKTNIKIIFKAGGWTENLSHCSLARFRSATESTESSEWSQAI